MIPCNTCNLRLCIITYFSFVVLICVSGKVPIGPFKGFILYKAPFEGSEFELMTLKHNLSQQKLLLMVL